MLPAATSFHFRRHILWCDMLSKTFYQAVLQTMSILV
nr:MAG TPA: hypothetical protein [Caudoviricetes sp.]